MLQMGKQESFSWKCEPTMKHLMKVGVLSCFIINLWHIVSPDALMNTDKWFQL